ncbi:hypothetical protein [Methylogaea oryzae]|uniref:Surface antigen domain-containing protein n=1 Tax=Methylogaea oryzae TaxID=1295382 RepID=A0A8D4VL76_9GAMM|nr:hypothetical protein [Methylogaea oryzae]BBL70163.1 hypothetical protein MoryE10_07690 [Methylogaea oryzae]
MKISYPIAAALALAGCAGAPGYTNPYANPYGAAAGYGTQAATGAMGTTAQGTMNAVLGVAATMILQSIAQNVWNGAIGSQLAPLDQTFRQQALVNLLQSGNLLQAQQWSNPATGNSIAMTPLRQVVDQQTQQNCQELEETYYVAGQPIKETRLACPDPATGKWTLVR